MKEGKTSTGFAFKVDEAVFDDMELLEMLASVDRGDASLLPDVLVRVLGNEEKKALYDHCRGEDGRVPITRVGQELTEIFKVTEESKKS